MTSSRLWCLLTCAVWGGCFGGPISDFPQTGTDNRAPSGDHGSGAAGDGDHEPGAPAAPDSEAGGGSGSVDAGTPDGPEPPSPIRPPTGYAEPDGGCTFHPPDGGVPCIGNYCGLALDDVLLSATEPGACLSDAPAMALVCQGEIGATVDRCWQWWLYEGGLRYASVGECAYAELAPSGASPACIDCYLAEYHCALSHCLSGCFDNADPRVCAACREEHCGEAFSVCSGLLAP